MNYLKMSRFNVKEVYTTREGIQLVRQHNLNNLKEVWAIKQGIPTRVAFFFSDEEEPLVIEGAFNLGYSGEGPRGLYTLLVEAGFPENKEDVSSKYEAYVSQIFEKDRTEFEIMR